MSFHNNELPHKFNATKFIKKLIIKIIVQILILEAAKFLCRHESIKVLPKMQNIKPCQKLYKVRPAPCPLSTTELPSEMTRRCWKPQKCDQQRCCGGQPRDAAKLRTPTQHRHVIKFWTILLIQCYVFDSNFEIKHTLPKQSNCWNVFNSHNTHASKKNNQLL